MYISLNELQAIGLFAAFDSGNYAYKSLYTPVEESILSL